MLQANALSANGNTSVGIDFERGAKAPNIRPPRAARHGPQDGALFSLGHIPGLLCGEFKFTVGLVVFGK